MKADLFFRVEEVDELPSHPCMHTVYTLTPHNRGLAYYRERTDRNLGWISDAEQEILQRSVVGIAGCGGMGGLIAATLMRLGIGQLRITDCETFDISNINRQVAATRRTYGLSKAFETARMLRDITDDTALVVYPQGITEETVDAFISGCDIVCDEIEFWAVGARILLHQRAKQARIPVMNCSSVGFGTRLFLFNHAGMSIEDMLGLSYEQAVTLQQNITNGRATTEEIKQVLRAVLNALIPELPEYGTSTGMHRSYDQCLRRLRDEQKAPIIATNPPMASGFLANHVVLELLKDSGISRSIVRPPHTPGYLYVDAAQMKARKVLRKEVGNEYC